MPQSRCFPALTICQPWAHLICPNPGELPAGYQPKRVENRQWGTSHRGPLAIHAGKSRKYLSTATADDFGDMAFGAVLGIAELWDCRSYERLERALKDDPYAEGPFCWLLQNVHPLAKPFPCQGHLGIWEVAIPLDLIQI